MVWVSLSYGSMVLERKREGELGEKEHARKEEEAHEQGMIDESAGKDEHRRWRTDQTTDQMGRSEDRRTKDE